MTTRPDGLPLSAPPGAARGRRLVGGWLLAAGVALWAGPALFALIGGTLLAFTLKRRRFRGDTGSLSAVDRRRAARLLEGEH